MKRVALSLLAGALMLSAAPAFADKPFPPDCHLEGINRDIDSVIAQVKSSPAYGHAAGHYKRAVDDLQNLKKQLHDGCGAWNMGK